MSLHTLTRLLLCALLLLAFNAQAQQSGNRYGQALASAARTAATVNSSDITNTNWRGAHVIINVSAYVSGTYTPTIQGKDPTTGVYYPLLTGLAISATGTTVLKIYPGIGTVANGATNDFLPYQWRVQLVGASTPSMTFSVTYLTEQ